jgi:hypothetical protein
VVLRRRVSSREVEEELAVVVLLEDFRRLLNLVKGMMVGE